MNASDVDKIVSGAVQKALAERKNVVSSLGITLKAAEAVIKRVFEAAKAMGMSAFAAVTDEGANPVAVMRMDGAILASYDIALGKAYTAVALKKSTAELASLAAPGGELYGIQHQSGGKIVVFGGGEPLVYGGKVVGGLGVSGGTLKQDIELALVGKKFWEDVLCR
ncbi:MAG: heme-binding protein [Clostridia bacterium]|nr:heme-binding protein [Clostridia bacterium]